MKLSKFKEISGCTSDDSSILFRKPELRIRSARLRPTWKSVGYSQENLWPDPSEVRILKILQQIQINEDKCKSISDVIKHFTDGRAGKDGWRQMSTYQAFELQKLVNRMNQLKHSRKLLRKQYLRLIPPNLINKKSGRKLEVRSTSAPALMKFKRDSGQSVKNCSQEHPVALSLNERLSSKSDELSKIDGEVVKFDLDAVISKIRRESSNKKPRNNIFGMIEEIDSLLQSLEKEREQLITLKSKQNQTGFHKQTLYEVSSQPDVPDNRQIPKSQKPYTFINEFRRNSNGSQHYVTEHEKQFPQLPADPVQTSSTRAAKSSDQQQYLEEMIQEVRRQSSSIDRLVQLIESLEQRSSGDTDTAVSASRHHKGRMSREGIEGLKVVSFNEGPQGRDRGLSSDEYWNSSREEGETRERVSTTRKQPPATFSAPPQPTSYSESQRISFSKTEQKICGGGRDWWPGRWQVGEGLRGDRDSLKGEPNAQPQRLDRFESRDATELRPNNEKSSDMESKYLHNYDTKNRNGSDVLLDSDQDDILEYSRTKARDVGFDRYDEPLLQTSSNSADNLKNHFGGFNHVIQTSLSEPMLQKRPSYPVYNNNSIRSPNLYYLRPSNTHLSSTLFGGKIDADDDIDDLCDRIWTDVVDSSKKLNRKV